MLLSGKKKFNTVRFVSYTDIRLLEGKAYAHLTVPLYES